MGWKRNKNRSWKIAQSEEVEEKVKRNRVAGFFRKLIPCCSGKNVVGDASDTDSYSISEDVHSQADLPTASSTPDAPTIHPGVSGKEEPTETTRRSRKKKKKAGSTKSSSDGRKSGAEGDIGCQDTPTEANASTVRHDATESGVPSRRSRGARQHRKEGARISDSSEEISEAKGDTAIQDTPAEARAPSVHCGAFERDATSKISLRRRKGRKSGSRINGTTEAESGAERLDGSADTSGSTSGAKIGRRDSLDSDGTSKTPGRSRKKKAASRTTISNNGRTGVNEDLACRGGPVETPTNDVPSSSSLTPFASQTTFESSENHPHKTPKKSGPGITTEWDKSPSVFRVEFQARPEPSGSMSGQGASRPNASYKTASRAVKSQKSVHYAARTSRKELRAGRSTVDEDVFLESHTSTTKAKSDHRDATRSDVFTKPPLPSTENRRPGGLTSSSFHGCTTERLPRREEPTVNSGGSLTTTNGPSTSHQSQRSEPRISDLASSSQRNTREPVVSSDTRLLSREDQRVPYNQELVSANSEKRSLPLLSGDNTFTPEDMAAAAASLARLYHNIKEITKEEDMRCGRQLSGERISLVTRDIPSGSPDVRPTTSTLVHRGSSPGSDGSISCIPGQYTESTGISPPIQRDHLPGHYFGASSPVGEYLSSWARESPDTMSQIQNDQAEEEVTSLPGEYIPSWADQSRGASSPTHRGTPSRSQVIPENPSLAPLFPSSRAPVSPDASSGRDGNSGNHISREAVSQCPEYQPSWTHSSVIQTGRCLGRTPDKKSALPQLTTPASTGSECVAREMTKDNAIPLALQPSPWNVPNGTSLPTRPQISTAARTPGFPSRKQAAPLDGLNVPSSIPPRRMCDGVNPPMSRPKAAGRNVMYSRYGRHMQEQTEQDTPSITDYSARLPPSDDLSDLLTTSHDQSLRSKVRKTAQSFLKPVASTQDSPRPRRFGQPGGNNITSVKRGADQYIPSVAERDVTSSVMPTRPLSGSSSGSSLESSSSTGYPRQTPSPTAPPLRTPPPKTDSRKGSTEMTTQPRAPPQTSGVQAEEERPDTEQDNEDQGENDVTTKLPADDTDFPPIETSSEGLRGWCLPASLHQYAVPPFPPHELDRYTAIMSCAINHVMVAVFYYGRGYEDGSQFRGRECNESVENLVRSAIRNGNTVHLDHCGRSQQISATDALQILRGYDFPGELEWDIEDILAQCREIGVELSEEELPSGLAMEIVNPSTKEGALAHHVAALDADKSEALLYTFDKQFVVFLPTRDGRVLLVDVHPHRTLGAGTVILVAPKAADDIQEMLDKFHSEHLKSPKYNLGQGTKLTYKMPPGTPQ